jgi:hypothetical protein
MPDENEIQVAEHADDQAESGHSEGGGHGYQ